MFGYVIPYKDELKVREYDVFRAYYCSLCNEIGNKSYVSKLTLTYDMTFLSILLSSIYEERINSIKKFCPFKMRKVEVIKKNSYIEYAAEMNIILSNRKLFDNYLDEKNPIYYVASKAINTKKLSDLSSDKISDIDYYLSEINRLEKEKCSSIDDIGDCFAKLTSEIFTVDDGNTGKILKTLGYNLGKWIYTIDAFDDLVDDIRKKRYNPFIYRFNYNGGDEVQFRNKITDNVQFTLIRCLDEISKAFELLDLKKNRGIIDNIVYLGMHNRTISVIKGGHKNGKSIRGIRG